jgi:hypothetical protein
MVMADVSFHRFANAFQDRLNELGYSLRRAEDQWPDTDRAMLSRAINGKTLSAGNYLLLCEMAGLDPYAYLERTATPPRDAENHCIAIGYTSRSM